MQLRHATLRQNLESITAQGLLPSKSRGKRQAVWLHRPSRTPWAILHMQARWDAALADVVILTVEVPRRVLRVRGGAVTPAPQRRRNTP